MRRKESGNPRLIRNSKKKRKRGREIGKEANAPPLEQASGPRFAERGCSGNPVGCSGRSASPTIAAFARAETEPREWGDSLRVARHTDAGAETLERVYWEKLVLKCGLLFKPVPSDGGDSDGTRLRRERHARSH